MGYSAHLQMSGINLLQYRPGALGEACYQRYLLEAYNLIHHYGGGLYYFAEVRAAPLKAMFKRRPACLAHCAL